MGVIVGTSELPGRTFGKAQTMSNVQAGYNLIAALAELKRDHGIVVTVNEADRSRPDQMALRTAYLVFLAHGTPWAALAAYCSTAPSPDGTWTSTHDPFNYGNAADLGGPNGEVISDAAVALLDAEHPDGRIGKKYGLVQTGKHFARFEKWHFNIYPSRALVLATAPDPTPDPAPAEEEDDDMKPIAIKLANKPEVYGVVPGTPFFEHLTTGDLEHWTERLGVKVIEVSGSEFLYWQREAKTQLARVAEAVWAKQFSDRRTAGQWLTALANNITKLIGKA